MTIPDALKIALLHHRNGQLTHAEALYNQILLAQPDNADALHFLGVIAVQLGYHQRAVDLIRKAIAINDHYPAAHCNLGEAYRSLGLIEDAIASYQRAIELKPDYAEAFNNLGNALRLNDHPNEALTACRRAIQIRPDYPDAYNNIAIVLRGVGQLEQALFSCRRALELAPHHAEAHLNLANILKDLRRSDEAIAAYFRSIELKPNFPEAHFNLGVALCEQGQLERAIVAFQRTLEFLPDFPDAHNNLGVALRGRGQINEALAAFRRALELKPGYSEAHSNLGLALREQGQLGEAVSSARRAIEFKTESSEANNNLGVTLAEQGMIDDAICAYGRSLELNPDYPDALNNLGNALLEQGRLDESMLAFRRALQIPPKSAWVHSNFVRMLHFHPDLTSRDILEEQRRWDQLFGDPLSQFVVPHTRKRELKRRLRIGYLSPDFRDHPVGRFIKPMFECHDRELFEVFCYSGVIRPDDVTQHLQALAAGWRNTVGVTDERLAATIREDDVDILVDLAMHTAGNRLPVFARKPAPVQVSWLAYPGSTGLVSIGYRLTDANLEPPGGNLDQFAGEPVRLPHSWCCYESASDTPEVSVLPASSAKGVTFGSLNNFAKVNDRVLSLWARILNTIDGSRLLILCPQGKTRERIEAFFKARSIAKERIEWVNYMSWTEYLKLFHRIDIALDPFPCNGMTTTCDALWMGVPAVTLSGALPVSRAGLSLLSSIGLREFAAFSEAEYLQIAVELARNLPRMVELRATLRARMQISSLMDAPRFAQNVETAYRYMWERWCAQSE